jgi:hypothetical protein
MLCRTLLCLAAGLSALPASGQPADPDPIVETRVDEVRDRYGLSGEGVIVAVLDRGLDVEHAEFRNADGTTRVLGIYDLLDPAGPRIYTREEIDAALAAGTRLAHRDAVGHGTTTMGIAAGNGRASGGQYTGPATEADLLVVKMVSQGAPPIGGEPAEAPGDAIDELPAALDWALGVAEAEGKPIVFLANFGSIGGPTDGTSAFSRALAERFGPGRPGRVFVTGTGDDGGHPNHAAGPIAQGETVEIGIDKGEAGPLRFEMWYDASDRFTLEVVTPLGSSGPYAPPANGARDTRSQGGAAGFTYYHNGTGTVFWGATNGRRQVLIDFIGQPGPYAVRLTGTTVSSGRFDAVINPARIFSTTDGNRLTGPAVAPGSSIWYGATAEVNIAPNSYVHRPSYVDVDGVTRTNQGDGAPAGELWPGSSVGPTYDGRLGTTVSVPGNVNVGAYAPRSLFATIRGNLLLDGDDPVGTLGAVSGAAPILTGIIALLLEADPSLDAAEVKALLQTTARADAFTGDVPNPEWGYGKADALAAVEAVLGVGTEADAGTGLALRLAPNPGPRPRVRLARARAGAVRVGVHDVLGREVAVLHDGLLVGDGAWRLPPLAPGLYVVRAVAEAGVASGRVLIVR